MNDLEIILKYVIIFGFALTGFSCESEVANTCPSNFNQFQNCIPSTKPSNNGSLSACCPKGYTGYTEDLICLNCKNYTEPVCNERQIPVKHFLTYVNYTSHCLECPPHLIANKVLGKCVPCHISFYNSSEGVCTCPLETHKIFDGICIAISELNIIPSWSSSYTVNFNEGSLKSDLFVRHFRISAYSCGNLHNRTACNMLANLCVLLQYSHESELNACNFYRKTFLSESTNLPSYVPSLYFSKNAVDEILNDNIPAHFSVTNASENIDLRILVKAYSLHGNYLGTFSWADIMPCPLFKLTFESIPFGAGFDFSCKASLPLIAQGTPKVYELFLHYDFNGTQHNTILPIIDEDYKEDGVLMNQQEMKNWKLVKRFYLVDTISGIESAAKNDTKPAKFVRVATSIEINLSLRQNATGKMINTPYVRVRYVELSPNSSQFHEIKIKTVYHAQDDLSSVLAITMTPFCIIAAVFGSIRGWGECIRSGSKGFSLYALYLLTVNLCAHLANMIYFVLFAVCVYWSIIYKGQSIVWLFLPSQNQEYLVKEYVIVAFCLKLVEILHCFCTQISMDIFFIDWEQPRTSQSIGQKTRHPEIQSPPVSIWRTYFIANEWNELQSLRRINLPFCIMCTCFILGLIGPSPTKAAPNPHDIPYLHDVPESFVLRFALTISVYISIAFLFFLFKVAFYERYVENKLQMFVDLCSMANISVLVLQNRLFGYYIHGQSVYGHADTDMENFHEQLKLEQEDLCSRRGLEPSSECQTFEIRMTEDLKKHLESLHKPEKTGHSQPKMRSSANIYKNVRSFLTCFLQHGSKLHDYIVLDKTWLEKALNVEFRQASDRTLFFRDTNHSFGNAFMLGEESTILFLELMLFTVFDILTHDVYFAGFVTFLAGSSIGFARYRKGRGNIVNKALLDGRFLL